MNKKFVASLALLLLALVFGFGSFHPAGADFRQGRSKIEVMVTNLTRGQIFSPPVVASHQKNLQPLFEEGFPASEEVAAIAEDAFNDPLIALLLNNPLVGDVKVLNGRSGPILPGESATLTIERGERISLIGMLVTTNDAFFALNGAEVPLVRSFEYASPAYDAGSEANNESCAFIPGPPCGKAGVRATEGAEGYVHIHAGIHGVGDLVPAERDWRNPVAKITLRRVHDK